MKTIYNDISRDYKKYAIEYNQAAMDTLNSGWYILGERLLEFEKKYAVYCGTRYCAGVASGLDALTISMRALGIGKNDEVITQSNAYIASVMGITLNEATPIFVEPDEYYGIDSSKIEEKITKKTKAILVVHLYGCPCEMDKIVELCKMHNLYLIEDCAQSHGAEYCGRMTGSFGKVGCFSFYPTKNLGAFGDAGCVVCDSNEVDDKIRVIRNYGSNEKYKNSVVGANSRMDELQAALLTVKLNHIENITQERIEIARKYQEGITNNKFLLPKDRPNTKCVYHQFVIRTESKAMRDKLITFLSKKGINTIIHYPIPPHLSEAYSYLGYNRGDFPIAEHFADTVLSIPIFNGYTDEEQDYVIKALNDF